MQELEVWMRLAVALLLTIAALTAIAVSMGMNFTFWTAQGVDARTTGILGALSIMTDVFKATLPLLIAWTWSQRLWLGTLIGTLLFIGCLVFSLASALGFSVWVRSASGENRSAHTNQYESANKELLTITKQLTTLAVVRPTEIVAASIARLKQDRRWLNSNQCKVMISSANRKFCGTIADLEVEFAGADERDRLEKRRVDLQSEIDKLIRAGARLKSDLQASALAQLIGVPLGRVQTGITLLVAVMVEFSAGFGLFLASLPLRARTEPFRPTRLPSSYSLRSTSAPAPLPTRLVRTPAGQLMIE